MNMPATEADQAWAKLATLPEEEREPQMAARYTELASLSEDERRQRLRAMAEAEYALPDDHLRPFSLSRLRVWLRLDPEIARTVAGSYDAVMMQMPGSAAWRRVAIVQTLAREFSLEDLQRLRSLIPGAFAEQATALSGVPSRAPTPVEAAPSQPKKPWWAFWKKQG